LAAETALSEQQLSSSQQLRSNIQESPVPYEQEWMIASHIDSLSTGESLLHSDEDRSVDASCNPEITDLNQHTNTVEFHGCSSSAAILSQVQKDCGDIETPYTLETETQALSLVSVLHNPGFSPQPTAGTGAFDPADNHYCQDQAFIFMESYFDTLHYIHPIIDKENFTIRAKELWLGSSSNSSFVPLYYSLLSLGALVRIWDDHQLLGMTRFEWSRKLFQQAQQHLDEVKFSNDLDTVQCLFLMVNSLHLLHHPVSHFSQALICQNELNPHCKCLCI
jgi:hypothetical protein